MKKITFLILVLQLVACISSCGNKIEKAEKSIFTIYTYDEFGSPSGSGSGFFIESNGLGVTNYHVLDGAVKAVIKTADGDFEIDSVYSSSQKKDLVVFRVDNPQKKKFQTLSIANKRPAKGDKVFNIGSPLGLDNTLTEGIVSSYRSDSHGDIVQTTAAISSGCSGSPLLNKKGEVFAVVSFKSKAGENLNFGIVIDEHFQDELDGKEFAKRNPKFNTKKSDFHILNIQCNGEMGLMLNAIEFSKSVTTAYFTFTNLNLSRNNYGIYANVSKEPNGFYIEDKSTHTKYYATSATISTDSTTSIAVGLGQVVQFKVFFPGIATAPSIIDIGEGDKRSSWKFSDINLEDYNILSIDDSKFSRELILSELNSVDENHFYDAVADAISTLSELVDSNPEDGISYNILGILYHLIDNNLDALAAFTDAIEANPNDALSYENRCELFIKQNDYSSALNDINKAIEIDPNNSYSYYRRGGIYYQLNDYTNSLINLDKCIELGGANAYVFEGRAYSNIALGNRKAAISDIQWAYRLSSDQELDQRLLQLYNSL